METPPEALAQWIHQQCDAIEALLGDGHPLRGMSDDGGLDEAGTESLAA